MSEIASAICFLLSQDVSYIKGTDMPVDGGYTTMSPEGFGEKSSFAGSNYYSILISLHDLYAYPILFFCYVATIMVRETQC